MFFFLVYYYLHYLQQYYFIKLQKRAIIIKLNYTSSEKQNVRSDQSSLSFRVGHCYRQVIGINKYIKYITGAKFRKLSTK